MLLFANNATAHLASGISPSTTTITVTTGAGSLYPNPTGGDYFLATLQEGTQIEIVHVTARSGDTMTVSRAQEGTSAGTFTSGAVLENRVTAANLNAYPQAVGAFSNTPQTNGGAITGTLINFAAADATHPGMISTGSQTFAGNKTFGNTTTLNVGVVSSTLSVGGTATFSSTILSSIGAFTSTVADGGSAVAFTFNTPSYSTVGDKLYSLQNNSVEKMSIDRLGTQTNAGGLQLVNNTSVGVSGSTSFTVRSNSGFAQISQGASGFSLLRNVSWVNPRDPAFAGGAKGDGVTDDTAAFQAAINATATGVSLIRSVMFIPAGQYKITATLTVPGSLGFTIIGEGMWASQLIFDPITPNSDFLIINSSQFTRLENFALWGKKSNPAGKMLSYAYSPVVNAATGNQIEKIWIGSNDSDSAYNIGIWLDDSFGNNSEMSFYSVVVEKFINYGVQLPGSQQQSINFYACQISGSWTGVLADTWGKVGLYAGPGLAGSFQYWGGGMSSCSQSGFVVSPNNPFIIDGVTSENCFRFLGGATTGTITPTNARTAVQVTNNRCDSIFNFDPAGYIQYNGVGPFLFQHNTVNGGHNGAANPSFIPQILLAAGAQFLGAKIIDNIFNTPSSSTVPAVIYATGAVDYAFLVEIEGNSYADSGGTLISVNEVLGQVTQNTHMYNAKKRSTDLWGIDYTQFTANAQTQTVELQSNMIRDQWVKVFTAFVYNYFTQTGGNEVFMKVGTTSGGDELLQEVVISIAGIGDGVVTYGCPGSVERGTGMGNGGGYMFLEEATKKIYVTLRVGGSGTLGNGTTTNLGRGHIHFQTAYEIMPRFIT